MLERTVVFVDTSYLLASFYNSWETGARAQLEIDLPEVVATLGHMVEGQLGHPVHRQNWYDGIPESGPHRYQRALRTCDGVQLRTGQLIEWGERRTQKAVDTRLVADMVVTAIQQHVTDFVLVSGDADMIPGVEEAINNGIRVHLYGFGWDSMSSALRHACDSTTILDPREDFADAMELQVLEGPLPPVIRSYQSTEEDEGDECPPGAPVPQAEGDNSAATDGNNTATTDAPDNEAAASPSKDESTAKERDTEEADADDCVEPSEAETAFTATPRTTSPSPANMPGGHPTPATVAPQSAQAATPARPGSEEITNESAATEQKNETARPKPSGAPKPAPKPSMMAPRRKLRSRYVPLPEEVWTSAGFQTPFDVGQQYATWWYNNAASTEQRDQAHLLSGGGLPPEIDRPLLQFACETLHEYTLSESQRVNLRDGFHSGIRGVLINVRRT
ncbi:NYN domain-containing protein [Corynebacterium incognita]|uniref:NYN domain-containing protein n=1 Tax=Corynebacterium incognita TaxID=2754725 RepID=A0A7G7CRZ6_9CORY|nr:NYN domain-containing protein [Corynebacterium incognita]QNE90362.1 NYN domain-containing protein [Corynebacterium incognita]